MSKPEFIYTTYINKTTSEKVWNAITNSEFTRQYWGCENISDWKKGSPWKSFPNNNKATPKIVGEVLESIPPKRLVMTWLAPDNEADKSEHSRVTFEIEQIDEIVRLVVTHDQLKAGSEMAKAISGGWPRVLSSLKTLLETGIAFDPMLGKTSSC